MADPIDDPRRLAAVGRSGLLDSPPEEVFDAYARTAAALLGAPFAFLTAVDDQRSYWKSRIGIESEDPADHQNTVAESFCQYVIRSDAPLFVGDARENPLTADNPSITSMGVRAWAGFPLHAPGGEVLGSFCVVDTTVRTWTEHDQEILRVLSEAAAREIAMRDVLASSREASRERDRLHDNIALIAAAAQSLGGSLNAERAISGLSELVVPLLGDWAVVSLVGEDGRLRDVGWAHVDPARRDLLERFVAHRHNGTNPTSATTRARETGQVVVVGDGGTERAAAVVTDPVAKEAVRALAPESFAAFPLLGGAGVAGVLAIARGPQRPSMSAVELETADVIARRAAVALENARLYRIEQRAKEGLYEVNAQLWRSSAHARSVAVALQEAMLSTLPQPGRLRLVARYLTADRSDQVGGDWYDAVVGRDGTTTVVIGDVAGHDISAAAIMGQLRNMLRAFIWSEPGASPAALIRDLDDAATQYGVDRMTTLFVARIEQEDADRDRGVHRLRWSCAGHPFPVLGTPDGRARLLDVRPDPPIGIGRAVPRHERVDVIEHGTTLVLYTDGLIETREQSISERQDDLVAMVGRLCARTDDTEDFVIDLVDGMAGSAPADDVAVLAVRFDEVGRIALDAAPTVKA